MFNFGVTWTLMKATWQVLKNEKKLMIFPFLSGICGLIVLGSFAIPIARNIEIPETSVLPTHYSASWFVTLFFYYLINYFIIIFFNSALISCVALKLEGKFISIPVGLKSASEHLPSIIGWAAVSATVGVLLRMIESKSKLGRNIISFLIGFVWSLVSYLVIPIMVLENKGPLESLKRSRELIKGAWGKQIIGNMGFGLVSMLLALPGIIIIMMMFVFQNVVTLLFTVSAVLLYLMAIALIQSTLQSIFQVVVFLYVRNGTVSNGFSSNIIDGSIIRA